MEHSTTRKAFKQGKPRREEQIKIAQDEWLEEATQLAQEKADLGFRGLPWEEFLLIENDGFLDDVTQSRVFAAQDRYKELINRQKRLWAEDNVIKEFNEIHAV